jgi:hypothetical protein
MVSCLGRGARCQLQPRATQSGAAAPPASRLLAHQPLPLPPAQDHDPQQAHRHTPGPVHRAVQAGHAVSSRPRSCACMPPALPAAAMEALLLLLLAGCSQAKALLQPRAAWPSPTPNLGACRRFANNSLSGVLPSTWSVLEYMSHLDLQYNQLPGSLPPGYAAWAQMKEMRLNNNKLTGRAHPAAAPSRRSAACNCTGSSLLALGAGAAVRQAWHARPLSCCCRCCRLRRPAAGRVLGNVRVPRGHVGAWACALVEADV